MNSTKRHPRTLNEAFPKTVEYGAAIEIPTKINRLVNRIADWALAVALGLIFAGLLMAWGMQ